MQLVQAARALTMEASRKCGSAGEVGLVSALGRAGGSLDLSCVWMGWVVCTRGSRLRVGFNPTRPDPILLSSPPLMARFRLPPPGNAASTLLLLLSVGRRNHLKSPDLSLLQPSANLEWSVSNGGIKLSEFTPNSFLPRLLNRIHGFALKSEHNFRR
ncbi:hypothetical protein SDJN03_23842, partial [Cucurbita argyrosperma subsp. sororia]